MTSFSFSCDNVTTAATAYVTQSTSVYVDQWTQLELDHYNSIGNPEYRHLPLQVTTSSALTTNLENTANHMMWQWAQATLNYVKVDDSNAAWAAARAENLFYDLVGKRAYNLFRKKGYHQIFGRSGRRYRLYECDRVKVMKGKSGNKVAYEMCIILGEYAPAMDKLVALILAFKSSPSSEANALRIGNRYEVAA